MMWSVQFFVVVFFFYKQKTAYEMRISDWSSDVCSSDLSRTAPARRSKRRDGAPDRVELRGDMPAIGQARLADHQLVSLPFDDAAPFEIAKGGANVRGDRKSVV